MSSQDSVAEKSSPKLPTSISIAGAIIFLLMLVAVALPEVLHYNLRKKQLEIWQQQIDQSRTAPATNPSASPVPTQAVPPSPLLTEPTDSAALFESYARFITLLVGLVSILGFFLGYFIRRSIRETEEDIDKKLAKSVEGWKDEQKEIKHAYQEQSERLVSKIAEVDTLKKEVSDLEIRLKDRLKALDESEALYRGSRPGTAPDAAEVAKAVDSELERKEVSAEGDAEHAEARQLDEQR